MHFKRKRSVEVELNHDEQVGKLEFSAMDEVVRLHEGGYKVFDEGQAMFKESEAFAAFFDEAKSTTQSGVDSLKFRSSCITRILRGLEVYAMSPLSLKAPAGIRHVLKRLSFEGNPSGAASLLAVIGRATRSSSSSGGTQNASSSKSGRGEANMASRFTPWRLSELEAAAALSQDVQAKRVVMARERPGKVGKRGPSSRMDYRLAVNTHQAICVDNKRATFFDDCFSLSPETGEVLVHISDVAGMLQRHEELQAVAKERVSSLFLPSGPLHMLPPQALESLRLSDKYPNEVITAAFEIDADTGRLKRFRVFPSVIGPVFPLDMETAAELLDGVNADRAGIPNRVQTDLVLASSLMKRVAERQPWVDADLATGDRRSFNINRRSGTYEMESVDTQSSMSQMLNAMLTLYSNATCTYCLKADERKLPVPVAWENRDKRESSSVRRFATQPLRNWLSMQQQRQVRAALKMEAPLSRRDCAMAVTHHNSKRRDLSSIREQGREQMSFESFEAHCATVLASGQTEVVLTAEGTGRGGHVRIKQFGVEGLVRENLARGQTVQVRVRKIVADSHRIDLELLA